MSEIPAIALRLLASRNQQVVRRDGHDAFNATLTENDVLMELVRFRIRPMVRLVASDFSHPVDDRDLTVRGHLLLCAVETLDIRRTSLTHVKAVLMRRRPNAATERCTHDSASPTLRAKQRASPNEACNTKEDTHK